ncbi:MAG TPA: MarR family transcriptional regulator [Alphaproteobacteria bacterium]|nr:MarR family transcriptional regulator [Alphaproteobacteria bacterium]
MFDLSVYLPYLLNRAGSRIAGSFSETLKVEHGLTLSMWRVLAALHHRDGQFVGELARMTTAEVSTLSRMLGTMQRRGLVERRRPALQAVGSDARTVAIHLTDAGRALTEKLIPEALRYEATALDGFTEDEARMLKSMLGRLFENMARLEAAPRGSKRLAS